MGCAGLVIAGGVFEVAGFALIAYELARVQRREFGEPEFLEWLRGWPRRIFPRHRTHTAEASASLSGVGTLRAEGVARRGPGKTLDERVAALEENFRRLEDETGQRQRRLAGEVEEVRRKLDQTRDELEQERREKEEERKAALRASVTLQATGTGLFVLGAILSVLGSTLTC